MNTEISLTRTETLAVEMALRAVKERNVAIEAAVKLCARMVGASATRALLMLEVAYSAI